MARPVLIPEPTQAMRDAVARAEPHISTMAKLAQEQESLILPDLCMQIGVRPKGIAARPGRVVADGVMVAMCSFSGFRRIPGSQDDPILRKLLAMEGKVPGDLALMVTHDSVGFQGWAIKDFGLSPLAVIGAL